MMRSVTHKRIKKDSTYWIILLGDNINILLAFKHFKHRLIKQTLKSVLVLTLEYELISST